MIWIIFYLIDIVLYYNKFIAGWVIINCIIAYVVKTLLKPYYKGGKGVLKTKSGEEISIEDIHNYYPEFKKHDKEVNYFSLAFAFTIYVWIRFLIWMILLAFTWLQCKFYYGNRTICSSTDQEKRKKDRDYIKKILSINYWLGFLGIAVYLDEVVANKEEHLKIYKKWLGEEFKVEFESDYSLLLCNHTGIFEIQYLMMKFAPGFIAKTTLKNTPFIGYLADKVETLWLDRKDANSRTQVAEAIKLRQEEFLKKKIFSPLIVFPEGTTTSGKHILKFRRGAFETLQPIKSIVFKSLNHDVGEGIVPTLLQFLVDLSRPYNVFQFIELPVIYPTVFMYENYKSLHPEISNEAEIFAEVIREIWCEIGNFEKSDRNFNDYLDYISLVFKKDTKNT